MAVARQEPMLEEFLKFPELEPALEFECGRVTQKVSPNMDDSVRLAVLVDPERRTVRVLRPGGVEVLLRGDDRIDLDHVPPGFRLTVRQLFDTLII